MEYLPSTLKVLHLGVAGLGLYVSIEGQDQLDPTADSNTTSTTEQFSGFSKQNFLFAAYIVTVVALVQLCVLFYFHNYGAKESHFRVTYFLLAMVNIIFSSFLLQGAVTLLRVPTDAHETPVSTTGKYVKVTGKSEDVAIAAAVLGALTIAFNFVNIYHASYARGGNDGLRITPRRK